MNKCFFNKPKYNLIHILYKFNLTREGKKKMSTTGEQFEKTKQSGKQFNNDSKKLAEKATKDVVENGEEFLDKTKKKCEPYVEDAKHQVSEAASFFKEKATYIYQKALVGLQQILVELQNPIVSGHLLFYGVIATKVLNGYAQYHSRYLKGKTDNEILLASGGTLLALLADGALIKKYYKKFDKK